MEEISTPGDGNRCLYYAVAIALGLLPTAETSKSLKSSVHEYVSGMPELWSRGDLERVRWLTRSGSNELATDEVVSVLARTLNKNIVVYESGTPVEFDVPGARDTITIGHDQYHFFGVKKTSALLRSPVLGS